MATRRARLLIFLPLSILTVLSVAIVVWFNERASAYVGSDYAAFTGDIVRAQQGMVWLRQTADGLVDSETPFYFRDRLLAQLDTFESRRRAILNGFERNMERPLPGPLAQGFIATDEVLNDLRADLTGLTVDSSPDQFLQTRSSALLFEGRVSLLYSQLHEAVHTAAADQKRLMQHMTQVIALMLLLLLLFGGSLVIVTLRLLRQRRQLEHLTVTDMLTDLPNRRSFNRTADRLLHLGARTGMPVSLAVMDLDHFKQINDQHGHPTGDWVLQQASARLHKSVRDTDTVARVGGEEFAVLMPDTDAEGALKLCERIRVSLSESPYPLDDRATIRLSASIGVATATAGDETVFELSPLYARADEALYEAKKAGRNRVTSYRDPGAA